MLRFWNWTHLRCWRTLKQQKRRLSPLSLQKNVIKFHKSGNIDFDFKEYAPKPSTSFPLCDELLLCSTVMGRLFTYYSEVILHIIPCEKTTRTIHVNNMWTHATTCSHMCLDGVTFNEYFFICDWAMIQSSDAHELSNFTNVRIIYRTVSIVADEHKYRRSGKRHHIHWCTQ